MGFAVFCVYMCAYCIFVLIVYVFLQYFDTVGWVFWPVKTVAHITYTVLVETLNHAQSIIIFVALLGLSILHQHIATWVP